MFSWPLLSPFWFDPIVPAGPVAAISSFCRTRIILYAYGHEMRLSESSHVRINSMIPLYCIISITYCAKVNNLLIYEDSYVTSTDSELNKLKNAINKTIDKLRKTGALTRREAKAAKATDAAMARFYGLKKCTSQGLAIDTIDGLLQERYDGTDQKLKRADIIELLGLRLKAFFTFTG
ncbi:unnamed protein product [Dibothriocephalus latus]|uniref:Uncharacterized protein n=1 Tax=Dibothriocephalus latus TaxID=60516 RepID=A0A3P6TQ92_DIBLA|nr:unnamed protein product [Dibothriocephalus latus]